MHGVVEVPTPIIVRDDADAVRVTVQDQPLFRPRPGARIELTQNVERDCNGRAKHDLADIDCHIGRVVHSFCKLRCGGGEPSVALFAVAVELQVREVER